MRREMGHSCPEMHTTEKGKALGRSCLLFSKAGLGIYIESEGESVAIHYTLCREREKGGKRETKLKERVPPATEHVVSYAKGVQYSE